MLKKAKIQQKNNFYFIGIGGIGMSSIAKYLFSVGKTVSGSDKCKTEDTEELKKIGIKVFYTSNPSRLKTADAVVYSSAIDENDEELAEALKLGVPVFKRSEILGEITGDFFTSIGVSGSHGKTTVTAMIYEILKTAGKSPTAFIGGKYKGENFVNGGKDLVVAETCEYKANFLDIKPKIAVVTNIADDHLDFYKTRENLISAFSEFVKNKTAVVNVDGTDGFTLPQNAVTVGIKRDAFYTATKIKKRSDGAYSFILNRGGEKQGVIRLSVAGMHNVSNALCAIAAAISCGADFNACKTALESFCGVGRRMEYIGRIRGAKAFADYAHHPDEITATLSSFDKRNVIVVFQPHTYSRTKILKDKFVSALSGKFSLVIYKTYPAREKFDAEGSAYSLYNKLSETRKDCFYCSEEKALKKIIDKKTKKNKTLLFLGAGNIYDIAKKIVKRGII